MNPVTEHGNYLVPASSSQDLVPASSSQACKALKAFTLSYLGLSIVNKTYWYTNLVRTDERIKEIKCRHLPNLEFRSILNNSLSAIGRKTILLSLKKSTISSAIIALVFMCCQLEKERHKLSVENYM